MSNLATTLYDLSVPNFLQTVTTVGVFEAEHPALVDLMFFPDPAGGLSEFRRVLRSGGRAAFSVNTVPERSYSTCVHPIIARYVQSLASDAARLFSLGDERKLGALFAAA